MRAMWFHRACTLLPLGLTQSSACTLDACGRGAAGQVEGPTQRRALPPAQRGALHHVVCSHAVLLSLDARASTLSLYGLAAHVASRTVSHEGAGAEGHRAGAMRRLRCSPRHPRCSISITTASDKWQPSGLCSPSMYVCACVCEGARGVLHEAEHAST